MLSQTPILPTRQHGTVLLLALVLLAAATVLGVTTMNGATIALRNASSAGDMVRNFQVTQAAIDYALDNPELLPTSGPLNTSTPTTLDDPLFNHLTQSTPPQLQVDAMRVADCVPPPRSSVASSLAAFSAFRYEVNAVLTNDTNGGRQDMTQGYTLLGPKC